MRMRGPPRRYTARNEYLWRVRLWGCIEPGHEMSKAESVLEGKYSSPPCQRTRMAMAVKAVSEMLAQLLGRGGGRLQQRACHSKFFKPSSWVVN